ncbi:MAG TPA: hypothetical protein VFW94_24370 [Candidatus Acidoferrales bacterium]|nr:hypothetical protein [Candidatus Acidoferrales bacterium]
MDKQQLQHAENQKELENQRKSLERIAKMLVGEKGDNGLVGTVTALRGDMNTLTVRVTDIKDTFAHLPKTILTILLIFGALISLLSFFGPSIRKSIGLSITVQHKLLGEEPRPTSASIPATVALRNGVVNEAAALTLSVPNGEEA